MYMTDNKNIYDNSLKNVLLFFVAISVVVGIFIIAFPTSTMFFMNNFESILLGIVIILGSLVLMSIVDLKYPEKNIGYKEVNKIVTLEA